MVADRPVVEEGVKGGYSNPGSLWCRAQAHPSKALPAPSQLVWGRQVSCLAAQAIQCDLSGGESPGQRNRRAVFLGRGWLVPLLLERGAQQVVGFERGGRLYGRSGGQVSAE